MRTATHVLILLLLFSAGERLRAQEQSASEGLPRVGLFLEHEDIRYFHLFEYNRDVRTATFTPRADHGLDCVLRTEETEARFTFDSTEYAALALWIEDFERITESKSSISAYLTGRGDMQLQLATRRLLEAGVLPPARPQRDSCQPLQLRLRYGDRMEARLLTLRDSTLALWTGDLPYDYRDTGGQLRLYHTSEIDSIFLPYTESTASERLTSWMIGTLAGMFVMAEVSRNASEGPGGSGNSPTGLATGVLVGGLLGGLPALALTGSVVGQHDGWRMEDRPWEETREELLPYRCSPVSPPELRARFVSDVRPRYPQRETPPEPPASTADWDAPFAAGVEMQLHLYNARSRPYSVLPGVSLAWQLPVLRHDDGSHCLSLQLRGMGGLSYYGAGLALRYRPEDGLRYLAAIEYLRNNDDLGKFTSSTMSNYSRYDGFLLKDDLLRECYASVGVEYPIGSTFLALLYRFTLRGAVVEAHRFHSYDDDVINIYAPALYGGISLLLSIPFAPNDIF